MFRLVSADCLFLLPLRSSPVFFFYSFLSLCSGQGKVGGVRWEEEEGVEVLTCRADPRGLNTVNRRRIGEGAPSLSAESASCSGLKWVTTVFCVLTPSPPYLCTLRGPSPSIEPLGVTSLMATDAFGFGPVLRKRSLAKL